MGSLKEKMLRQMGLDQPSGLDLVQRSQYANDEAYLDAAVKAELERENPEYQAVRRRLSSELERRREEEELERQNAVYQQTLKTYQLSEYDREEIDREARALAQVDLAAGRIFAHQMGESIEKHAAQLTETRRTKAASAASFNDAIRRAARVNRGYLGE